MDNLHLDRTPQRDEQSNWLILSLRLLGGTILGYFISFFLMVWDETANLPLLGLVIYGQEEMFELVSFYALYDKFRSIDLTHHVAWFVYASLWAIIVALLVSGWRKLIRLGVIFFILYILTGCLSYLILAMMRVPT